MRVGPNGEPDEAREVLEQVVALSRERRLGRQYLAFMLGSLAQAHLERGDPERALVLSEEATAYARRAGTAAYGLRAELVVAATRIARAEHRDAEESLERCEALVQSTGSDALGPFVTELRARLAAARDEDPIALLHQAHQQFDSVGATGHVERLARELA